MSFRVYVYRPHKSQPLPDDSEQWDDGIKAEEQYTLYNEPLGADGTIYHYWHLIAHQLSLPLIASIYNQGLKLEDEAGFTALDLELQQLEIYWNTQPLETPRPPSAIADHVEEHLRERMGYLRKALNLARSEKAVLGIS